MNMKLDQISLANVLNIPEASRSFLVGMTGSGKSTLAEVLLSQYMQIYQNCRVLIADTKPRFRASRELHGWSTKTSMRYRKWGYGSGILPNSFVLPHDKFMSIKGELDQIWRLGGRIAIVQSDREKEWEYVSDVVRHFYEDYGASIHRIVLVDELADFFKYRSLGDIFQRIARNGRERNVALIAGSQRPRKVPLEVMTEMTRLYMFKLDFMDDIKHVYDFGIPRTTRIPDGYTFYMYDRKLGLEQPSNLYYELDLTNDYWKGGTYNG